MSAQVIRMDSVSRACLKQGTADAVQEGFDKALAAVKSLNVCRSSEIKLAIENWAASDMLTEAQADSLCGYFGFERAT
jgi:hypothetical protein